MINLSKLTIFTPVISGMVKEHLEVCTERVIQTPQLNKRSEIVASTGLSIDLYKNIFLRRCLIILYTDERLGVFSFEK